MAATSEQKARLRRMTGETGASIYSDADIAAYIERYPLLDERGAPPYTYDLTTTPPSQDSNEDWIPTYDLNAAAADIMQEKAANLINNFEFWTDGGKFLKQQQYDHAMEMARRYQSRRSARTISTRPEPALPESVVTNAD